MLSLPSSSQVQQYVRIALYGLAGALGQQAFADGTIGQWLITAGVGGITLIWTLYATRLAAKINDLVGADVITPAVGEKLKDVAVDPTIVVNSVQTKPSPPTV